jgi:hypothetical protein
MNNWKKLCNSWKLEANYTMASTLGAKVINNSEFSTQTEHILKYICPTNMLPGNY